MQVKLPPPPSFEKPHAPEQYPDGSYSVYGARASKSTTNKEIRVRGFIIDVYVCPKCPRGAKCKPCEQPHLWLADRANASKDDAMMVTDYKESRKGRKLTFAIGDRYVFAGTFAKNSPSGFAASDGLLVYASSVLVAAE